MARSAAWIRGAFCFARPPMAMTSVSSSSGAAITSPQDRYRRRSCTNARPEFRSDVFWERIVRTSSATGSPDGTSFGRP